MAKVLPAAFLVSETISVILLVVKDNRYFQNMWILFYFILWILFYYVGPHKYSTISMMFCVGINLEIKMMIRN